MAVVDWGRSTAVAARALVMAAGREAEPEVAAPEAVPEVAAAPWDRLAVVETGMLR